MNESKSASFLGSNVMFAWVIINRLSTCLKTRYFHVLGGRKMYLNISELKTYRRELQKYRHRYLSKPRRLSFFSSRGLKIEPTTILHRF